jgi:hypothetical protein
MKYSRRLQKLGERLLLRFYSIFHQIEKIANTKLNFNALGKIIRHTKRNFIYIRENKEYEQSSKAYIPHCHVLRLMFHLDTIYTEITTARCIMQQITTYRKSLS